MVIFVSIGFGDEFRWEKHLTDEMEAIWSIRSRILKKMFEKNV